MVRKRDAVGRRWIVVMMVALFPASVLAAGGKISDRITATGEIAIEMEEARIDQLAASSKYAEIDRLADDYVRNKTTFPDGRYKVSALYGAVRFYTVQELPIEHLDKQLEWRTKGWRASNPKSPLAEVSEAYVWEKYAWRMRGGGYANTVSAAGWKGFEEYRARAEKILIASKEYSSSLPLWYELMMGIQLTKDKKEMFRYYKEGLDKFPWFFPLHFAALRSLLPQWGGSYTDADKFIVGIAAKEGDAMYTRLYWYYAQGAAPGSMFKETRASWPRMKKGFQALLKSNQNDIWTANNYAKFACEAGDKAAFRQADTIMNGDVDSNAWDQNLTYQFCRKAVGGR